MRVAINTLDILLAKMSRGEKLTNKEMAVAEILSKHENALSRELEKVFSLNLKGLSGLIEDDKNPGLVDNLIKK